MLAENRIVFLGSLFLMLAVLLGAFGAHGLKNMLEPAKLVTYNTGITYHFYHGFGLIILGIIQKSFADVNLKRPVLLMCLGILLFSFNCYLYALTSNKIFAMIVPLGGFAFVGAWLLTAMSLYKVSK